MKTTMFKMALFAAFAKNLMSMNFNNGVQVKNNSVAWRGKRKKFKGWQRQNAEK